MKKLLAAVLLALLIGIWLGHTTHAQTAQAATFSGGAPHTTCAAPLAGAYFLCVASDGIWVSNNGAAYFQLVVPVVPTGVISVNGKTGVIVLSATTTVQ